MKDINELGTEIHTNKKFLKCLNEITKNYSFLYQVALEQVFGVVFFFFYEV